MAKDKTAGTPTSLGTVVKKYDSGICETDKGHKVNGKFEVGSVLLMDIKTKKVSVKTKNTTSSNKNLEEEPTTISSSSEEIQNIEE